MFSGSELEDFEGQTTKERRMNAREKKKWRREVPNLNKSGSPACFEISATVGK